MHDRTDPRRGVERPEVQLEIDGIPAELPLRVRVDDESSEPFRIPHLVRSIAEAGAASGAFGDDIALGVARAVGLYLMRSIEGDVVAPDAIGASVVEVLRAMGYRSGAEHFRRAHSLNVASESAARSESAVPADGDVGSILLDGHGSPESVEVALAERATQTYALDQLVRPAAARAVREGLVSTRGLARLNTVHRIALDAEGLKLHGTTSPDPSQDTRPARNPVTLGRHLADQTGWLAPFVDSAIVWRDVNHSVGALAPEADRDEYRAAAQVIVVELTRGIARLPLRRPSVGLGLSWDDPASTSCGGMVTSEGNTIDPQDVLHESREAMAAFLDCLANTNPRVAESSLPTVRVDLSPYFFGAPEAGELLRRLGEIAIGPLRLSVRYVTPEAELLPADDRVRSPEVVAQHVSVNPFRVAAPGPPDEPVAETLERAMHAAAEVHAAKHRWLERVVAREDGPFAMLRGGYGRSRWLDLAAFRYTVHATEAFSALDDDLPIAIEAACARWAEALGMPIMGAAEDSEPGYVCDEPAVALSHAIRTATRYRASVAPRPATFRFPASTDPDAIGDLIREAFLGTACRSLLFLPAPALP